jgi:hypothetical protein
MPRTSNLLRNSVTGAIMWLAAAMPVAIAATHSAESSDLVVGLVICAFAYSACYARLTQFRWCFRAATLAVGDISKLPT